MQAQVSATSATTAAQTRADEAAADAERARTAYEKSVSGTAVGSSGTPWTPHLVQTLGFGFLVFALLVIAAMLIAIRKNIDHGYVLRAFGIILIVTAAVFLVIVGYDQSQMAPVIGLLGTIAGYLLGSKTGETPQKAADSRRDSLPDDTQ